MRIDGFTSSYSLDRTPLPGSAVTPYREAQREAEQSTTQTTATPSSAQGFEQVAQIRRVQSSTASSDNLPVSVRDSFEQQRSLSARANQALAAYGNTASYTNERDATEVLGLDLYA